MEVNSVVQQCHRTATDNGWWDDEEPLIYGGSQERARVFLAKCALITSEISEAVEAMRDQKPAYHPCASGTKPEGWGVELVDAIIRTFDLLRAFGVTDVEYLLRLKMDYNKTRTFRHGDKSA